MSKTSSYSTELEFTKKILELAQKYIIISQYSTESTYPDYPSPSSDQYAQSQFTASQMSEYNAVNNPLWIAPYETWDEPR